MRTGAQASTVGLSVSCLYRRPDVAEACLAAGLRVKGLKAMIMYDADNGLISGLLAYCTSLLAS